MRIFIDTNIIISSVLFPLGKVSTVLKYIIEKHDIIISTYSIKESEIVFERKFPNKREILNEFYRDFTFELFKTPSTIQINKYPSIRDHKDLPILVSAILSDADVLLTGDKDFEDIKIEKPLIFSPNQYFELMEKKDN